MTVLQAFSIAVEMLNRTMRRKMNKKRRAGLNEPLLNGKKEEGYSVMV